MGDDIASTLSGFALGEVLSSLDLDTSALGALQSQLGIKRSNAINRDSIYADRFADDDGGLDDEDLDDDREDFEAMIDREMREEKYGKAGAAAVGGAAKAGGQAAAGARLVRGEEDDFDEEYDEDEPMAAAATAAATPVVKEEPADDLFGAASPAAAGAAPARALEVEDLAAPPAKQVDVRDLFPSFEPGKVLDFTELFGTRPRKKRRVITEGVKRASSFTSSAVCLCAADSDLPLAVALPNLSEVPRARSSRDALVAPLRPLPPSRDDHVRRLLLEAKVESMRESGQAAGEEEGSEDEELRRAVEVRLLSLAVDRARATHVSPFPQRVNRRSKAKWRVPEDDRAFDLAELDEWEDQIVWGEGQRAPCVPLSLSLDVSVRRC